MIHSHSFEVGGKSLSIETGRVAKQAGGSVLLGMGETDTDRIDMPSTSMVTIWTRFSMGRVFMQCFQCD